jgi:hypothetical protein
MSRLIPDVEDLSVADLKKLVLQLLEEVAALKAENAALREEIARWKGLKGRPKLHPSGMETATEAERKDGETKGGRRRVERGDDFLALDGWKRKWQRRIVRHGGCGKPGCRHRIGVSIRILLHINRLRYIRQPLTRGVVNKTG